MELNTAATAIPKKYTDKRINFTDTDAEISSSVFSLSFKHDM